MNREQIEEGMRKMGIQPAAYTGQWVNAACPFAGERHAKGTDKHPSFGVSIGNGSGYYCLACKASGRFVDLPRDLGVKDYGELQREFSLAEALGLEIDAKTVEVFEEIPALAPEVYDELFEEVDYECADYLESRGVAIETADALGIMDWPEERRVMFPIRDFEGRLYGWTGRAYDEAVKPKVWNLKGVDKSCHLLGIEHATGDVPLIVVEGLFFYAYLSGLIRAYGWEVDVVAAMGSSLSKEQQETIIMMDCPVIMFFDNDKAGQLGTWGDEEKGKPGAVRDLSHARVPVSYVTYPDMSEEQLKLAGRVRVVPVQDPDHLTPEQIEDMLEGSTRYTRKRKRNYAK